ncbi:penicillin-binding transpeptidase domain-containing protein, partial [Corynebacterium sp. 5QC2CO]
GQSALVSLDAHSGALKALVGGFSFSGNKFNRATQARRQPGSSFKPFVYAAAFDKGYNPASIVLDAPVVFRDRRGKTWAPQNDGGGFRGPMRLREALVQSRNLVSVRLLDGMGVDYARKYISEFGFAESELPPNLSMSLGTASLTPLSVARG